MPASSVAGSDFSAVTVNKDLENVPKIRLGDWERDWDKFVENTTTCPGGSWKKVNLHKVKSEPSTLKILMLNTIHDFAKYFAGKDYLSYSVYEVKKGIQRIRLLQDDRGTLVFVSCTFDNRYNPIFESAYIMFPMDWAINNMPISILNLFDSEQIKSASAKSYQCFYDSNGKPLEKFGEKNFVVNYAKWKEENDRLSGKSSVASSPTVQTPKAETSAFDPLAFQARKTATSSTTIQRPEVSRSTKPSTTVKGKERQQLPVQEDDDEGFETAREDTKPKTSRPRTSTTLTETQKANLQRSRETEAQRVARQTEEADKAKEILEKAAQASEAKKIEDDRKAREAAAKKAEADRLAKIESDRKAAEELAEKQRLETEKKEKEEKQRIEDERVENERKRLELEEQQKVLQRQAEEAKKKRDDEKQARKLAEETREREEREKKEREEAEALAEAQRISDAHASEIEELKRLYFFNERKLQALREKFHQHGLSAEEEVPQLIDKGKKVDYSHVATTSDVTVEQFPEDDNVSLQADLQVLDAIDEDNLHTKDSEREKEWFFFTQDGTKVMYSELGSLPREDLLFISLQLQKKETDLLKLNEDLKKNNSKLRKSIFEFGSFNPLGWFTSNYEGVRSLSSEEESGNSSLRIPPIPPIGTVFRFSFWFFVVFFVFYLLNMIKSFFGLGEKGGRRR